MDPLVRLTFRFGVSCHWRRVSHKKKYIKKNLFEIFEYFFIKKKFFFRRPRFYFFSFQMKKNEKFSRPSRRCVTSFHARFREYFYIFLSCLLFCFDRRFHLRVWLLFFFLHISLFCVLRARISTPRFVLFVCLFVFFVGTDC